MSEILRAQLEAFRTGRHLAESDTAPLFDGLVTSTDERLLTDLLLAWEEKGVTEDELFHLADLMRSRMKGFRHRHPAVVDIVGTGGSRTKTFNVSTAAAFVVAGAGVPVAKHGNRAATSTSGSADVLELLGVRPDVSSKVAEQCLDEIGICFMFAPRYHSLSPVLSNVRRALGRPCIFNNLGPLCNPAKASHQVIGVWDRSLISKTGNVLRRLGTARSWVVHGETGLDEIARKGVTYIADISNDGVTMREISIADFESFNGHGSVPEDLGPENSAVLIRKILSNKKRGSNSEKLVLINAAAAIYVAGHAESLPEAFALATKSVASGAAGEKLRRLAEATNE